MAHSPLSEYGAVGNGRGLALVSRTGSVDWMCVPRLDSPAVFAALLDDRSGGRFAIRPDRDFDAASAYRPGTNLLETRFRVRTGEARLTDFMPDGPDVRERPENAGRLIRRVRGEAGEVRLRIVCDVRFDYGRRPARWERRDNRCWRLVSRDRHLLLTASRPLFWEDRTARLRVRAGETVWLVLDWGGESVPDEAALEGLLDSAERYWRGWRSEGGAGRLPPGGFWRDALDRSALALRLLQYRPAGAVAAGGTAALPVAPGGGDNRDDRVASIHEAADTLTALSALGRRREADAFVDWVRGVLRAADAGGPEDIQRLDRPRPPAGERIARHLAGYKGAEPVRLGRNPGEASALEISGEVLDLFFAFSRRGGEIGSGDWTRLRPLVDRAAATWRRPDSGRAEPSVRPGIHARLMAWVALDRGIRIALRNGFRADLARWRNERAAVRQDILRRGVSRRTGAFRTDDETGGTDDGVLRIPLVGFLPATDRRVAATLRELDADRLREDGFLLPFFRYLRCRILQGRLDEVAEGLRRVREFSGPSGLLGERYDPVFREIGGNLPRASAHAACALATLEYLAARNAPPPPPSPLWSRRAARLFRPARLSPPRRPRREAVPADPNRALRDVLRRLADHFYDAHEQRVDYAGIRSSAVFDRMRDCVADLRGFDPETLGTDAERIAFWINLFNLLTIHAVVALGVRDSVREIPFFFRRATYVVGGRSYRLGDIEHGVLRGNRRPPFRPSRPFGPADPRLRTLPETPDPRTIFGLVRAARTGPPLGVYAADTLGRRLDASARVFLNGTSRLDMRDRTLWVSELFKRRRSDIGARDADLVRFVARFWYRTDPADWLVSEADRIAIRYFPFDWRLNR